jgi:uncharacterized membrane protein
VVPASRVNGDAHGLLLECSVSIAMVPRVSLVIGYRSKTARWQDG